MDPMRELQQQVGELQARVRDLEQRTGAGTDPLSVQQVCARLGISRRTFYRCRADLDRLGLVPIVALTREPKFDAESVERVRVQLPRSRRSR